MVRGKKEDLVLILSLGTNTALIEVAHTLQDAENRILSVKNKSTH